jgi:LacI family transcriptional regulator
MNMKRLANMLGLSQTTVSRALNGHDDVSVATRQRVEEAARKLGYRPNASARRLATGRAGVIGLTFAASSDCLMNPHFSEFLAGLGARMLEADMDLMLAPVERGEEMKAYRRLIASRTVDALVVSLPKEDDERIDALNALAMPYIVHGRTLSADRHAWLDIDNMGVFQRATRHLLDLGHRRIGLANGLRGFSYAEQREKGFRTALEERGVQIDENLVTNGEHTDVSGREIATHFLNADQPPTAIVASSMTMAMGILRVARSKGLVIGRDLSLIAHDDVVSYLNPHSMLPSLTVTRSSIREAGHRIGELVLELIEGRDPTTVREVMPAELILGDSTGPVPR